LLYCLLLCCCVVVLFCSCECTYLICPDLPTVHAAAATATADDDDNDTANEDTL
jgi:hypothetical protein